MELIAKIRAEIERISSRAMNEEGQDICGYLLSFLDTLQEQYVKDDEIDFEQELYNHFGQVKDFTLGMRIGEHFYKLGKNSVPLPEDTVLFNKGVEEGKRLMMDEAEPAEIGYFNHRGLSILTEKSIERMPVSEGDKVRVIILKEEG